MNQLCIYIYPLFFGFPSYSGHYTALRKSFLCYTVGPCYLFHVCAQLCPALCDPMDCSPPGSSVHGISQARILEWVVISSSGGSSQPRDWIYISCGSCIAGKFFTWWALREAQYIHYWYYASILYTVSIVYTRQSQAPNSSYPPILP